MNYMVLWHEPCGLDAHIELMSMSFKSFEEADKFSKDLRKEPYPWECKIVKILKTENW